MTNKENRLKRLECKASAKHVFIEWKGGRSWTVEEKAEEIHRHPEGGVFWKSVLKAFAPEPKGGGGDS